MLAENEKIECLRKRELREELNPMEYLALRTFDAINKSSKNYTQESFAVACDFTSNRIISEIINMKNRNYDYSKIYTIARVLKVSIDYLLGRTDNPYINPFPVKENHIAVDDLLRTLRELLVEEIFTLGRYDESIVLKCSNEQFVGFAIAAKNNLTESKTVRDIFFEHVKRSTLFDETFASQFSLFLNKSEWETVVDNNIHTLIITTIPFIKFAERIERIKDLDTAVEGVITDTKLYILNDHVYNDKPSYTEALLALFMAEYHQWNLTELPLAPSLLEVLVKRYENGVPIFTYDEEGEIDDMRFVYMKLNILEDHYQKDSSYRYFLV